MTLCNTYFQIAKLGNDLLKFRKDLTQDFVCGEIF